LRERGGGNAREVRTVGDAGVERKFQIVDAGDYAFERFVEMRVDALERLDLGNVQHKDSDE
jgi:hypothetical protein